MEIEATKENGNVGRSLDIALLNSLKLIINIFEIFW